MSHICSLQSIVGQCYKYVTLSNSALVTHICVTRVRVTSSEQVALGEIIAASTSASGRQPVVGPDVVDVEIVVQDARRAGPHRADGSQDAPAGEVHGRVHRIGSGPGVERESRVAAGVVGLGAQAPPQRHVGLRAGGVEYGALVGAAGPEDGVAQQASGELE